MENRALAVQLLQHFGCSVEFAGDGAEALAKLQEQKFDLVFMDCHMPHMDGFEATRRIRADEQESGTHTPIVALTADAWAGDRERCIAVGMDDYMTKPVSSAMPARAVQRWTGRRMYAVSQW